MHKQVFSADHFRWDELSLLTLCRSDCYFYFRLFLFCQLRAKTKTRKFGNRKKRKSKYKREKKKTKKLEKTFVCECGRSSSATFHSTCRMLIGFISFGLDDSFSRFKNLFFFLKKGKKREKRIKLDLECRCNAGRSRVLSNTVTQHRYRQSSLSAYYIRKSYKNIEYSQERQGYHDGINLEITNIIHQSSTRKFWNTHTTLHRI